MKSLTNFQINKYLRDVKGFMGCYFSDNIPPMVKMQAGLFGKLYYITNLDNEKSKSYNNSQGTHWTCIIFDRDEGHSFYIDSFGFRPDVPTTAFINQSCRLLNIREKHYNTIDFQRLNSSSCGWFSLYIILRNYFDCVPIPEIIANELGTGIENSENVIEKYFRNHK